MIITITICAIVWFILFILMCHCACNAIENQAEQWVQDLSIEYDNKEKVLNDKIKAAIKLHNEKEKNNER